MSIGIVHCMTERDVGADNPYDRTMNRARAFAVMIAASGVAALTGCAPPGSDLAFGPSEGTVHICLGEFADPLTYGDPIELAEGTNAVTLVTADLVGAEGVRVMEQAASRAVLLDDGTHLGVGMALANEGGEAWDARVPLRGTVVEDDGGETWFVALAIERTSATAGGFEAVDLTYETNGRRQVVRSAQSVSFPAIGDACSD
ncbi:hypothetical protein AB3M83_05455 [Microbacterium sp. 179-B 1A2 NHS]|uniref:hypothetical protein n=1 Tax=Microbacterium sp. 179-B 1A2 NHS TaxID=3142383 RepID=UPI0039A229CA